MSELDNGKILLGDVGTGKSLTAVAYYMAREHPRDVYVITTAKKRDSLDWEKEFAHFGISTDPESSRGGARLIIDSWNNLKKYKDIRDGFFVLDEQRIVGTGSWTKAFWKIAKHNRWILLSATPGDIWLDYAPVFVANGWYKNITEFKREHVVYSTWAKFPKVERYLGVNKLVKHRNAVLVKMPMLRHTTRIIRYVDVEHDRDQLERVTKDRWNVFEEKPLKDVADLFRVARKVVNSDASRLTQVRALMEQHPRLIVFYNFDYELEMLRTLSHATSTVATDSSKTADIEEDYWNTGSTLNRSTSSGTRRPMSESSTQASPSSDATGTAQQPEVTGTDPTPNRVLPDQGANAQGANYSSGRTECDDKSSPSNTKVPSRHPRRTSKSSSGANSKSGSGSGSNTSSMVDVSMPLVVAEWNGHKHQPVPTSERWVYLVQYTAGSEGWNCVTTDAMVFWSPTYSYKSWHQAFGRIDRMNTKYSVLHYYVLRSKSWIDLAIFKALRSKKSFNEASSGFKW